LSLHVGKKIMMLMVAKWIYQHNPIPSESVDLDLFKHKSINIHIQYHSSSFNKSKTLQLISYQNKK
jgi:hypothetical protein